MMPSHAATARFLVLEGVDGAGKSSHIPFIRDWLIQRGQRVCLTREPGGSALAEHLRTLMLNQPMDGLTEALAVFAARRDHLTQTVWPALQAGQWVLSDRYVDSSWAYQGAGRGVPESVLRVLTEAVESGPDGISRSADLVLYFDLEPEQAAARRLGRQLKSGETPDRFEQEDLAFFNRVREGYRAAARRRGHCGLWLDASQTIEALESQIAAALETLLS
jgi:dTMP kinase